MRTVCCGIQQQSSSSGLLGATRIELRKQVVSDVYALIWSIIDKVPEESILRDRDRSEDIGDAVVSLRKCQAFVQSP